MKGKKITIDWLLTVVAKWSFILLGMAGVTGVCIGRWNHLLTVFVCTVMAYMLHKDQRQEER